MGEVCDNCADIPNADQLDSAFDGVGDACDRCEGFTDSLDTDGDSVPDSCDNCIDWANADQADDDGDGMGNICDQCPQTPDTCSIFCDVPGNGDADPSGIVDMSDLISLMSYLLQGGAPPANPLDADIDDYRMITLRDILYLHSHLHIDNTLPLTCPPSLPALPEPDSTIVFGWLAEVPPDVSQIAVPLTLITPDELIGFNFPLRVRVDGEVPAIDSVVFDAFFDNNDWINSAGGFARIDQDSGTVLVMATSFWGEIYWPAGYNPVAVLYLTVEPAAQYRLVEIDWTVLTPVQPMIGDYQDASLYPVVIRPGIFPDNSISAGDAGMPGAFLPQSQPLLRGSTTCCIGLTGNVNGDALDDVDMGDLTRLIDYLFISMTPLTCPDEY